MITKPIRIEVKNMKFPLKITSSMKEGDKLKKYSNTTDINLKYKYYKANSKFKESVRVADIC